ncbi:MAG: rRNA maturation RNase YbeY [Burkholderiales bacterium]|nr:rRNA maturation RNase YbeY [Burkholderiales bacterium]
MPTTRASRKNRVFIQYAVPRRGVPSAAWLRTWARAPFPVTLRIVGEREGRRLNNTFRKKNRATNVLTFATGDIVLCHPVIRREARAQGKSIAAHYAHLVVHGILHLRGYDHENKRDAARMEAREIGLLRRAGIGNPYALE